MTILILRQWLVLCFLFCFWPCSGNTLIMRDKYGDFMVSDHARDKAFGKQKG